MRALTAAIFLLALAPTAAQAEWLKLGSSVSDVDYYVDLDRIRTVSGMQQIWVKFDHSRDRSVSYRESLMLYSYNCSRQSVRLLYYINKDSYGKTVSSKSAPDYGSSYGYEPIVPDSVAESISKIACYDGSGATE